MDNEVGGGSTLLVQTDAGEIYDDVITSLERSVGEPLYPGDERRIFGEALSAILARVNGAINDAALQTTVRFARGEVLDAIGARLGVQRIPGSPAECTLRFCLAAPRASSVAIPAGARAVGDGSAYFATNEGAVIPAGETSVEVRAAATEAGSSANGLAAGSVATLVDLIPFVSGVSNVTATTGGDDGETYDEDGDERFRARVLSAPARLSTAGPEMGYVYWAMAADAGIADVAAVSETEPVTVTAPVRDGTACLGGDLLVPDGLSVNGASTGFTWSYDEGLLAIELNGDLASEAEVEVSLSRRMDGRVRVVVLMEGGAAPDDSVLGAVSAAVNARDVRPMTDLVTVAPPEFVEFDIEIDYWAPIGDESAVAEAVEGSGGAIERFVADQCAVLGRDINPDMLKVYAMRPADGAGATRCIIKEPTFVPLGPGQAAKWSGSLVARCHAELEERWA